MKKIALSTDNKNKIIEISKVLDEYGFEIITKSNLGIKEEFLEIYNTLVGNAKLKAKKLKEYCDYSVLADDTGLFVESLNGEPGVYSARYASDNAKSSENREKLLKNLEGKKRDAYFKTVIVFIDENGEEFIAEGVLKGQISKTERGENGFGYDKIFIPEGESKTLAEISLEEKNKFSHRKRALEDLKRILGERYDNCSSK